MNLDQNNYWVNAQNQIPDQKNFDVQYLQQHISTLQDEIDKLKITIKEKDERIQSLSNIVYNTETNSSKHTLIFLSIFVLATAAMIMTALFCN